MRPGVLAGFTARGQSWRNMAWRGNRKAFCDLGFVGLTSAASSSVDISNTSKVGQKIGVSLLCWHAPHQRDHPDYCNAEVGNPWWTYELPCISLFSSPSRVGCCVEEFENSGFCPGADTPTQKTFTHFPFNIPVHRAHTYMLSVFHTFPRLHFSYFAVPLGSPLQGHCFF